MYMYVYNILDSHVPHLTVLRVALGLLNSHSYMFHTSLYSGWPLGC